MKRAFITAALPLGMVLTACSNAPSPEEPLMAAMMDAPLGTYRVAPNINKVEYSGNALTMVIKTGGFKDTPQIVDGKPGKLSCSYFNNVVAEYSNHGTLEIYYSRSVGRGSRRYLHEIKDTSPESMLSIPAEVKADEDGSMQTYTLRQQQIKKCNFTPDK